MKIKITTTIENVVELDKLSGLTQKEMKKHLKNDLKIAHNRLSQSILYGIAETFAVKSPREHLNQLRVSADQDFDDALRDVLLDVELSKHNPFSVHR